MTLQGEDKYIFVQEPAGYFRELTLAECRMALREIEGLSNATPGLIAGLVTGLLEDSERLINPGLFRESRIQGIGFNNGIFDLLTGKMRKYTSSDFILAPLPHNIPDHIDPDIERWFLGILEDWVSPGVAPWFRLLLAYLLFIYPNGENLWVNFFEAGRNGKSSCLKLLERIVGDEKAIGCDLQHINRFSNATFQGKWLILGRDSSSFVSESATSFIKNYSGDEKALVEVKGGTSYDDYVSGKIIVSTNNLIQSKDRSFGWYRRLIPVPFPHKFPLNPQFERTMFKHLPQIIRIVLHSAYLYRHNDIMISQTLPKPVESLKQETRFLSDRVAAFWELDFFEKVETQDGTRTVPNSQRMLHAHQKSMLDLYGMFEAWHHRFFGDGTVEPSLKSFGGPYGAFLSHAKDWYYYTRKRNGRFIELRKDKYDELMEQEEIDSMSRKDEE